MGAALCTCGGNGREGDFALRANLQAHARSPHKGLLVYSKYPFQQQNQTPDSQLLSRGETNDLSDEINTTDEDAKDALSAAGRQNSALAIADAFRAKLQEPILSPRSKFALLGGSRSPIPEAEEEEYFSDEPVREDSMLLTDDEGSVTEEDWKLRANPFVRVIVSPGPCGLILRMDTPPGTPPIVEGFVRNRDGSKCTIENSQLVQPGSMLCAINGMDVTRTPIQQVLRTLNLSSHLEREFTFRDMRSSSPPRGA